MSLRPLLVILACAPLLSLTGPAAAASEAAMLQSYVGNYTGSGVLAGGTTPQTVKCRLNIQSTAPAVLDYTGRCTAGGAGFSMTGIISFAGGKFTAAMSSSTLGVTATVAGQKRGDGVVFSSKQNVTMQGSTRAVTSTMALTGGAIRIDFSAADSKTGKTTSGSIPFAKTN
jgi:hypothetical protein